MNCEQVEGGGLAVAIDCCKPNRPIYRGNEGFEIYRLIAQEWKIIVVFASLPYLRNDLDFETNPVSREGVESSDEIFTDDWCNQFGVCAKAISNLQLFTVGIPTSMFEFVFKLSFEVAK